MALNYCPNPYAATVTTGATALNGTLGRSTGFVSPWLRTTGFNVTGSATAGSTVQLYSVATADLGAINGQSWSGTLQWAASVTGNVTVGIAGCDASGTLLGVVQSVVVNVTSVNTPQETKLTGTLPASSKTVRVFLSKASAPASVVMWMSAVRYEQISDSNLTYYDGNSTGWLWQGTTGNSTSTSYTAITSSDIGTTSESFQDSTSAPANGQMGTRWDWRPSGSQFIDATYTPADGGGNYYNRVTVPSGTSAYSQTVNGRLEPVWSGTLTSAQGQYIYYHQQITDSGKKVSLVGAEIGFGPGSTNTSGGMTLAILDQWPNFDLQTFSSPCHMGFTATDWKYWVIEPGFVVTTVASGTYTIPLNWSRLKVEVSISGNTATVLLPDGTTTNVTDSRIGSLPGHSAFWEFSRQGPTATTGAPQAFYRMYANPATPSSFTRDSFVFSDSSLVDTTGSMKLGTDAWIMTESSAIFARPTSSDTGASSETRSGATSATSSDMAAHSDQSSTVAAPITSDTASLAESNSIFQGLLKYASDLGTVSDLATVQAFFSRTDTATQTDILRENQGNFSDTATSDTGVAYDYKQRHGPLVSDLLSFSDVIQPRFNYLWTADTFTWVEQFFGNFQFSSSDTALFYDDGVEFTKPRITEDPFTYPESYYGSTKTRIIAQDHFTREFIHWDLPIDNLELTFSLSGPNLLKGQLSTEIESITTLEQKLEPYRTWLHVEDNNYIIASFILTPFVDNPQTQTRGIEAEGFSSYPHSVYWEDSQYIGIQVDPADMIRKLWNHVQSYPDGNLYVKIWPTITPVRIGYPNNSVQFNTPDGNQVSIQGEPYNLNFWSVINCGEEINRLCQESPIEYWEYSVWNEFKTDVEHYIVLGYPRVGSKRDDLVFREGENLVQLIPSYQEAQENYASDIFVIGAGQGPGAVRVKHSERIGRLRRTHVIQDQQISNKTRAQAIADFEFTRLSKSRYLIENITIDTTHTNARWGTFIAGDDIYLECTVPYVGLVQAWYRITEYVYDPYSRIAMLSLSPSDSFSYGATIYNPYADIPHEGYAVLSDADFDISDGSDADAVREVNIKLCQQAGVEGFNKNNVKNGFAYAYRAVANTTQYATLNMPIDQVIDPYFLIIGRTSDGYLITGENVYLVSSDGTIGQPPESTNTTPNPTAPPAGPYSASLSAPFPVKLQLAAREYSNAFQSNIYISPELTYMGMSANAESWRQTIAYQFYTLMHGQYNYEIKSPGGQFVQMVSRIANNIGTAV